MSFTVCGEGCELDLLWRSLHYMYKYQIKSLCCVPETNIMLYVSDTSIFKKRSDG